MNTSPSTQTNSRLALFISVLALVLGGYSLFDRFSQPVAIKSGRDDTSADNSGTDGEDIAATTAGDPANANISASPKTTERSQKQSVASNGTSSTDSRVILPTTPVAISLDAVEAEANQVVERLLGRLPDEPMALHVSAMLKAQLHESEAAKELWSRCIELSPKTEQYYINLATLTLDRGNSELALKTLEDAEKQGLQSLDISVHTACPQ